MQYIENTPFHDLKIGQAARLTRKLTGADLQVFGDLSSDANPAHLDNELARSELFSGVIGHGMWGNALIANLIGTELPGPGTQLLQQDLRFPARVELNDTVEITLRVASKDEVTSKATLSVNAEKADGTVVITGEVTVTVPAEKIRRPRMGLTAPHLHERGASYARLIEATRDLPPIRTAVVHPCDGLSLNGALEAADQGIITPILVGPRTRIEGIAAEEGRDISEVEVIDSPHSHAAAEAGVALVRAGQADAVMKGKLHTDELLAAIVDRQNGLRTERRMSHVFALDVPHYPKPLYVTDAAINIAPDLDTKADIVRNAIDLVHAMGQGLPKVAIVSAVETVYPKIGSTLDAAALCKMADRGQIKGGLLDGPLAFDNAVSMAAVEAKGIVSDVAGDADILVMPDLEAGNMVAKQLIHLAGAESAGILLGARVPVILTSRADGMLSRLASAAMAQLLFHHKTHLS